MLPNPFVQKSQLQGIAGSYAQGSGLGDIWEEAKGAGKSAVSPGTYAPYFKKESYAGTGGVVESAGKGAWVWTTDGWKWVIGKVTGNGNGNGPSEEPQVEEEYYYYDEPVQEYQEPTQPIQFIVPRYDFAGAKPDIGRPDIPEFETLDMPTTGFNIPMGRFQQNGAGIDEPPITYTQPERKVIYIKEQVPAYEQPITEPVVESIEEEDVSFLPGLPGFLGLPDPLSIFMMMIENLFPALGGSEYVGSGPPYTTIF